MGRIVWLASYPKSGNTWLRVFLTNYQRGAHEPADINDLDGTTIASSRVLFDEETGVEASDLTVDEIARYRPRVYSRVSDAGDEPLLMKVHDAFTIGDSGPMFPAHATAQAIYLVRNPLDVAVSFAEHSGVSLGTAVDRVCTGHAFAAAGDRLHEQLPQRLLSWNDHVESWIDQTDVPIFAVRYEDMLADPLAAFSAVVIGAGLALSTEIVVRAVGLSRFDVLQSQEQQGGFKERPPRASRFFRHGRAGGWRDVLGREQVARIVTACRKGMIRFGYLAPGGELPDTNGGTCVDKPVGDSSGTNDAAKFSLD